MKRVMNIQIDSTLIRQINAARLSDADRRAALDALRTADMMVDAAEWVVKKIEQFSSRLFLRPSFKH